MKLLHYALFTCLALNLTIKPGLTRNLVLVGQDLDGRLSVYLDTDTVNRNGPFVWGWFESTMYNSGRLEYHIRQLISADCTHGVYRVRTLHVFVDNKAGVQNRTAEFGDRGQLVVPPPRSVSESVVNALCR